jgi:hypothetical protein
MGSKKRDTNKTEANRLITILFQKALHNSYFDKLPFGSKSHFEKMPNTILPLVVLSWLQQLEEIFSRSVITKRLGIGMITESIVPLEQEM